MLQAVLAPGQVSSSFTPVTYAYSEPIHVFEKMVHSKAWQCCCSLANANRAAEQRAALGSYHQDVFFNDSVVKNILELLTAGYFEGFWQSFVLLTEVHTFIFISNKKLHNIELTVSPIYTYSPVLDTNMNN